MTAVPATRMLPQDLEAERAALGSMLLDAVALGVGLERLKPEMLMQTQHRVILETLRAMHARGIPVDLVTTRDELTRTGQLKNAGGVDGLVEIAEAVPSAANVTHYLTIIEEHHRRRALVMHGRQLAEAAVQPGSDPVALAETFKHKLEMIPGGNGTLTRGPVLVCMADVEPREVQWLWPGRVPMGRITLLVGRPGEGKSFFTVDAAARVSTGRDWPDGTPCPSGSVILISAEDDPADTIRPRLDAHNADVTRVHLLSAVRRMGDDGKPYEMMFTMADVAALETALQTHPDCKLIVVDPIGSFLGGSVDAHRDNEVRGVLAPVAWLAERYGPAVLVVAHRRKSTGSIADDLAIGSRAFTGVARAVWHLSRDREDNRRRLLLPGKINLAAEGTGLAFRIGGEPPSILWEPDPVTMTADDALAQENGFGDDEAKPGPEPEARNAAAEWLRELLRPGARAAAEVRAEAKSAEFGWRTVQRAAEDIGVRRRKCSFGGGWTWELPAEDASPRRQAPEDKNNLASWRLRDNGPENADFELGALEDAKLNYLGTLGGETPAERPADRPPPEGIPAKVWAKIRARKAAAGPEAVPDGWTPTAWGQELRRMADVCGMANPERAADYRRQADELEAATC